MHLSSKICHHFACKGLGCRLRSIVPLMMEVSSLKDQKVKLRPSPPPPSFFFFFSSLPFVTRFLLFSSYCPKPNTQEMIFLLRAKQLDIVKANEALLLQENVRQIAAAAKASLL